MQFKSFPSNDEFAIVVGPIIAIAEPRVTASLERKKQSLTDPVPPSLIAPPISAARIDVGGFKPSEYRCR